MRWRRCIQTHLNAGSLTASFPLANDVPGAVNRENCQFGVTDLESNCHRLNRGGSDKRMNLISIPICNAYLIDPSPHIDERGRFMRAWCAREFAEKGLNFVPVQANMGFSRCKGTLRGMHFQLAPALEAKLVRCTKGAMFDVVLDLRPASATFGKSYGVELSAENGRMLFLPEGCAHGYQTLEDCTEMYYMTSAFYAPDAARGVRFDDPAFQIQWPLTPTVISEQDRSWPPAAHSKTGA